MSDLKYSIISRLSLGEEPREIANELEVSYPTVLRYRREFEAAKTEGTLDKLLNMDKVVLAELAETVADTLPAELIDEAKQTVQKLTGLEKLSTEFQSTASQINTKIRSLVMGVDSVSELEALTDSLCALQNAFFNKQQVNIQNNYGETSEAKYSALLSDVPAK
jgi:hypothetical protein